MSETEKSKSEPKSNKHYKYAFGSGIITAFTGACAVAFGFDHNATVSTVSTFISLSSAFVTVYNLSEYTAHRTAELITTQQSPETPNGP